MSFQDGTIQSIDASGALDRFNAVDLNGSDQAQETDANGDSVYGVTVSSQDASGKPVDVKVSGRVKCEVDGSGTAISPGDDLMPDSSTTGALISHDGTAGARFVAKALEASSAAGDVIEVQLFDNQSQTT